MPDVGADRVWGPTIQAHAPVFYPDAARAQAFDGRHVVRHEEDGTAAAAQVLHRVQTSLPEAGVADCEYLIDKEDIRVQVRCDGEP
jgi:hypothetical protein